MKAKLVIVIGAGATLSEALQLSKKRRPPLDKGFFDNAAKSGHSEFTTIKNYLKTTYDFDPCEPSRDSLEAVIAIVYADIHNPQLEREAVFTFRALIKLFNRRIAETTNRLAPTNRFKLYRILCSALDSGLSAEEICIITFNQDIQIEKTLLRIEQTQRWKKHGRVLNFPFCYYLPNAVKLVTSPSGNVPTFPMGNAIDPVLPILKLHGSLNWFSTHKSRLVPKSAILDPQRGYHITPRTAIPTDMTYTVRRRMYTFPLIIPPVTHKAGILHADILPLWREAEGALQTATTVVIFGYSCPENDFESANLIRRTIRQNKNLEDFSVVDPDPGVFQRYVDLTGLDRLYYFKNANSYLSS